MAENWIKVRKSLRSDMRIIGSSRTLGVSVNEFYGAMVAFFCWADEHTADGRLPGLDPQDLDGPLVSDLPGFGNQLIHIRWVSVNDDGLTIEGFENHMSQSAKKRANDSKRQRTKRCHADVTKMSHSSVTKSGPDKKESKSKKKNKRGEPPQPPADFDWSTAPTGLDTPAVRNALAEWVAYRKESKLRAWQSRTIGAKLREYESRPDDFVAAVKHSIANGWQGVFEDKSRRVSHATVSDSHNHDEDMSWVVNNPPQGRSA